MATVAFLGTGTMGLPMARNLASAGFHVRAWNRSIERARPLTASGVELFDDPGAAARGADVLVTMLSDAPAVLDTTVPALEGAETHATWIQMSTIGMEGTDRCLELARRSGVVFVDSPVLGTREPAEQGGLVILASGPDSARSRCQPLFDAVGSRTLWLGEAGAATRCKVVVNSWVVGIVAVLAETIALAQVLEVDERAFFDAVEGGALDLPYARLKGEAMIKGSFGDPSFRLSLARKDAELILAASEAADLEVPVMQAVAERLRRAERNGHGGKDMAATYLAAPPERTVG